MIYTKLNLFSPKIIYYTYLIIVVHFLINMIKNKIIDNIRMIKFIYYTLHIMHLFFIFIKVIDKIFLIGNIIMIFMFLLMK